MTAPPTSLAVRLGHRFGRPALLEEALTHRSAAGMRTGNTRGYERLEFLGDRVLSLVIADLLLSRFPNESEGQLSRRHSALVRRASLVRVAIEIDLGCFLRMSKGEDDAGARAAPALLADACEAVIAALYLDGGLSTAAKFIEVNWTPLVAEQLSPPRDAKTALQEWAQGHGRPLPVYRTVHTEGPAHEPRFSVEVEVEGAGPMLAEGPSKRAAEQAAAAALLHRIQQTEHG